MSQQPINVFIPFLANVPKNGPTGGFGKLKRYISKIFAKSDANGAMTLGTVKKVEIVVKKRTDNMYAKNITFIANKSEIEAFVATAYIRFIPAGTRASQILIDEINSENGLKLVHNTSKDLFWVIYRQRKDNLPTQQPISSTCKSCPLCGHHIDSKLIKTDVVDEIMNAFDNLTCDENISRKRTRTSMKMF